MAQSRKKKLKRKKKKNAKTEHKIKNKLLHIVTTDMFETRVVTSKKNYRRKEKHKSKEYDLVILTKRFLNHILSS